MPLTDHPGAAPPTDPLPHHHCPLCGGPNACGPARSGSFDTPCWCREVPVSAWALAQVAGDQGRSCLCMRCAQLEPGDARPTAAAAEPPPPQR